MIIIALILAWFLNLFDFGEILCKGMAELFNKNITINGYYVIFFLIGLVFDLFSRFKYYS